MMDDEGIRWFAGFDASVGDETGGCCCASTNFSNASVKEKAGCGGLVTGATGIIGTPKNCFTPGVLITEIKMKKWNIKEENYKT